MALRIGGTVHETGQLPVSGPGGGAPPVLGLYETDSGVPAGLCCMLRVRVTVVPSPGVD